MTHIEAVTDDKGRFEIRQHLPPGRYQIMAARKLGNPLLRITDYHESKQTFTIEGDEKSHELTVRIPK